MPATNPTPPATGNATETHRILMFEPFSATGPQVAQSGQFQKIMPQTETNPENGDPYHVFRGDVDLDGDGIADSINCIEGPMAGDRMFYSLFSDAKRDWYSLLLTKRKGLPVSDLRFGDVDGDGKIDVLVMLEDGAAMFMKNQGIQEIEVPAPSK